MLKSDPGHDLITKSRTPNLTSARIDEAVAEKNVNPLAAVKAGDAQIQRESATRRAHRLRMKDFFSHAKSAS